MKLTNLLTGHRVCYRNSHTGKIVSATVLDIIRNEWLIVRVPHMELPVPVPAERVLYREFPRGASPANS